MPIYEYECQACGEQREVLQKLSEPPLTDCPACGEPRLKKLLSAPQFRLAGGGWYETDFKGDKDKKRNLAGERDTSDKSDKADKGDKKTEAKPEKKADTKKDKKADA